MPEGKEVFGYVMIALAILFAGIMYVSSAKYSVDPNLETAIEDGLVKTIEFSHSEIHEGDHYKAGYQNVTLNTGDTIELLLVSSNTPKWIHFALVAQSTGAGMVQMFESPNILANGVAIVPRNRNRNSNKTSSLAIYLTPTILTTGSKWSERWIGNDGKFSSSGGEVRGDRGIVLKQNTKYLIRFTALADNIKGAIGGDWCEHTFT